MVSELVSGGWQAEVAEKAGLMRIAGRVWSALILVVLAVAAGGVQVAAGEAASVRPNVLFIMADDYRAEMGAYGSPAKTPNLDRLAAGARVFRQAYCQQAVCNPSRSSLLTGRRPDALQIWNNSVHFRERNPDVMTLPLWFRRHGYQARCTGKIFHNWHTKIHGDPVSWSAPEFLHFANHGDDRAQVAGSLPVNHAVTTKGFGYAGPGICECRDVPDEAYYDGRVAAEAVRLLGVLKDQPFFLAITFSAAVMISGTSSPYFFSSWAATPSGTFPSRFLDIVRAASG